MHTFVQKGSKKYLQINIAFFVAGFTIFTVLYSVQPLLPYFVEHYKISETKASLALSISTFTLAFSILFFGAISEAIGRKNIMVFSVVGTAIFAFLLPFVESFQMLLVLRGIIGIVLAGLPSIAMAYLAEEIQEIDLTTAIGIYISGNALGATFGRVFTGAVASYTNQFEIALIAVAVVSLIACILFICLLPASRNFQAKPLKFGYLLSMYVSHLKNGALLIYCILGFILLGSNVALFNYIGFSLIEEPYNLHDIWVSLIYLLFLLGMISSTYIAKVQVKLGLQKTFQFTLLFMIFGISLTLIPILSLKILGVACSVFAFFSGHSLASSQVSINTKTNKAQASSLYLLFYYIGSSIGGSVSGLAWEHIGWIGVVGIIILGVSFALLLVTYKK